MVNYEDVIRDKMIEALGKRFGIKEDDVLYRYLYLRYLCERLEVSELSCVVIDGIEESVTVDFCHFLIKTLGLSQVYGQLNFKGENVSIGYSPENSILNIVEEWCFRSSMLPIVDGEGKKCDASDYVKKQWKEVSSYGKNKAKKYKADRYYRYYLISNLLSKLNELYAVDRTRVMEAKKIDGFLYEKENCDEIIMEYKCERYIHASRFKSKNVAMISEKQLEDYICRNLGHIEEGLEFVSRQVIIENGRIDILARDSRGITVIIELKVAEDKEIVWQGLYYPQQYKREHGEPSVRFITLCPNYPTHIKIPLKMIGSVELYVYKPVIENGRLARIEVERI